MEVLWVCGALVRCKSFPWNRHRYSADRQIEPQAFRAYFLEHVLAYIHAGSIKAPGRGGRIASFTPHTDLRSNLLACPGGFPVKALLATKLLREKESQSQSAVCCFSFQLLFCCCCRCCCALPATMTKAEKKKLPLFLPTSISLSLSKTWYSLSRLLIFFFHFLCYFLLPLLSLTRLPIFQPTSFFFHVKESFSRPLFYLWPWNEKEESPFFFPFPSIFIVRVILSSERK